MLFNTDVVPAEVRLVTFPHSVKNVLLAVVSAMLSVDERASR
jgi:hypothetical protein